MMIRISEAIREEGIVLDLKAQEKVAVIRELVSVLKRENLESTGIGLGVAIPHARTTAARELLLTFGRSAKGVDFDSLDGKPSHLIFLIAAPEENKSQYIMALARLSKILRKEEMRMRLSKATTSKEVIDILKEAE
jgi:mannitol/fructose-specific phosphotransferase system IIA component (Ntr-type)